MKIKAKHQIVEIAALMQKKVKFRHHGGKWVRANGKHYYRAHYLMAIKLRQSMRQMQAA